MTKAEETFLVILKEALHPGDQLTTLPSKDWASILEVAKKQNGVFLRGETSTSSLSEIDKRYELTETRLQLLKKYGVL